MTRFDRRALPLRRSPRALAPMLVLLFMGVIAPRTATAQDALSQIEDGAALVVLVKLQAESALWRWLGSFGGALAPKIAMLKSAAGAEYKTALGFDPTGPSGWEESGLHVDRPIAASFFALDATSAEKFYTAQREAGVEEKRPRRSPRPLWRHRLVAPVRDSAKVNALLAAAAQALGDRAVLLSGVTPARLAALLGAPAQRAAVTGRALAKKGIVAVARSADDEGWIALVALRGEWLVIDAFSPFGGGPLDWERDGKAIVQALDAKPRRPVAVSLGPVAAGELPPADAALWLQPTRLLDLGRWLGRENVLAALRAAGDDAQRRSLLDEGEREIASCEQFRPVADEGPLGELMLTLRAEPKAFVTRAVWSVRPSADLVGKLPRVDDGVIDLAAADDAVAVGAVYLDAAAALRALPRPGVLGRDLAAVRDAMHTCGGGGAAVAVLFGWPQLLALLLEEEIHGSPRWEVLRHVRNLGIALRSVEESKNEQQSILVASFDAAHQKWIDGELEQEFKRKTTRKVAGRALQVWTKSSLEHAFRVPLGTGRLAYGVSLGGLSVIDWFWRRPAPRVVGPPPHWAAGRINLPRLFQQMGKQDPENARLGEALAQKLGHLLVFVQTGSDRLAAEGRLEIR